MSETSPIERRCQLFIGAGMAGVLLLLAGCATAPTVPPPSFAAAEQAIEIAEQEDASHFAAAELDEAREKLKSANAAFAAKNTVLADRLALESTATAELAAARTEATKAAAVNDELSRGVEALTEEMRRTGEQQ